MRKITQLMCHIISQHMKKPPTNLNPLSPQTNKPKVFSSIQQLKTLYFKQGVLLLQRQDMMKAIQCTTAIFYKYKQLNKQKAEKSKSL